MAGMRLIIFLLVVACLIGVVVLLGSAECKVEVESNDTTTAADGLGAVPGSSCRSGAVLPAGDVDMYWFEVREQANVVIETRTDGDTLLSLYDSAGKLLAEDDDGGDGRASRLEGSIEVGTYVLVVYAYGANVVRSYEVWIEGTAASSRTSDAACPSEKESNNTMALADDLTGAGSVACRSGSVAPVGDVDVYSFSLGLAGAVTIVTMTDADTVLRLYDSGGRFLAEDDDGAGGRASRITGTLEAGRYYATVREYGDDATVSSYRVSVTVQASPGGPSGSTSTLPPPPASGAAPGATPPWGWSIWGGGIILSAWGAIDRDCPSDYDFNMGLCDKKTYTFTLGSAGFIAVGLVDQAGEWITAYVYDAGRQRVASKLGVSRPIYSDWVEVPAGTYTVEVVPGKRLDNSPYELHIFYSATRPDPGYLVRTYGPADRQLPG
ncbi:MAG: pre-peptidase C-terminal domain-containing protein [Candidatus Bipolaricaulota bacterium]|nr:pre-peptidase C-terminal domain-containing protein [Candidatus Bipolaricaulota bacterium]